MNHEMNAQGLSRYTEQPAAATVNGRGSVAVDPPYDPVETLRESIASGRRAVDPWLKSPSDGAIQVLVPFLYLLSQGLGFFWAATVVASP